MKKKTALSKKTLRLKRTKPTRYVGKSRSLSRRKITSLLPKHNVNLEQKDLLSCMNVENLGSTENVFEIQKKRRNKRHKKTSRR